MSFEGLFGDANFLKALSIPSGVGAQIYAVSQRTSKLPLIQWPKPHIFGHGKGRWYSF